MMQIKLQIDAQWAEINRILQQAGAAKTPGFDLSSTPGFDPTNFAANLQAALSPDFTRLANTVDPTIQDIDSYYAATQQAQAYFFIAPEVETSLEDLLRMLLTFQKTSPDPIAGGMGRGRPNSGCVLSRENLQLPARRSAEDPRNFRLHGDGALRAGRGSQSAGRPRSGAQSVEAVCAARLRLRDPAKRQYRLAR